jgi:(p)ppGpp synthase/HD superfamily hydrolase
MSTKIDLACEIAAIAHNCKNRKGKEIPYIVHPMAVAILLAQSGASEEVILAGILHDTVEDTDITLENIKEQFGLAVADIVEGCSEPDKSKPWEDRKEHTLEALKTASDSVWLVTCADKLHNVRDMVVDYKKQSDALWVSFNRGKEEQVWYYRSLVESLGRNRDFSPELFDEFKAEVDNFLEIIKLG